MKKALFTLFVLANFTGCATYVAKQSWDEARARDAIRVEADGEQVLIGVDLLSTDYLKDNWKVALPAAVVDGFLIYQTYQWVDDQNSSGGGGSSSPDFTARDTNSISISGDGNSVSVTGDTVTTTDNTNQTNN
jgi:hypothetical protein